MTITLAASYLCNATMKGRGSPPANTKTCFMNLAQKIAVNMIRAELNILGVISKRKAAKRALTYFCTPFGGKSKKIPRAYELAEKIDFDLDGKKIKGYRFNHPATTKVLIIHGFESSAKNFDRYVAPFVRKGYEVLLFDAPAHGRSEGKQITLPDYKKTLEEVCRIFGPIHRFMAHSYGGLALAHLLEVMPHDENTKAVLIAPATETVSAIQSFFKMLDLKDDIRKEFDQLIYDRSGVWPDYFSIQRTLPHIRASILWIHDEEDEVTPLKDTVSIQEAGYPNVEFMITKGLGHRKIYRENKVQRRVVDFL